MDARFRGHDGSGGFKAIRRTLSFPRKAEALQVRSLHAAAFQADRRGQRPHFVPLARVWYKPTKTACRKRRGEAFSASIPLEKGDKCRIETPGQSRGLGWKVSDFLLNSHFIGAVSPFETKG